MEERKHIDRLFQEKFKDHEVQPQPELWNAIEQQLMKKKKRRIVPLWFRYGSAAAILLLVVSSAFWFSDSKESNDPLETITNEGSNEFVLPNEPTNVITNSDSDVEEANESPENNSKTNEAGAPKFQRSEGAVAATKENKPIPKEKENESTVIAQNEQIIDEEPFSKEKLIDENVEKALLKEKLIDSGNAVAQNENKEDLKKDITKAIEEQLNKDNLDEVKVANTEKRNKWYVGAVVAPLQYGSLGGGSPVSASLNGNDKNGNTTVAYGLKVNYVLNDRFSIQSGVNSVDLSYSTQDVTAFVFSNQLSFSNNLTEQANVHGSNTIALGDSQAQTFNNLEASRGAAVTMNGDLEQSISYVEVPLEIKYALTKTKLGINLVGGVSTYILNKNNISMNSFEGKRSIGEATNLNNVNFSTNVGLDLDYKVNKKMFINVSPMFKYQLNTFSENDGGFKPYFLGVYTGLNFRF